MKKNFTKLVYIAFFANITTLLTTAQQTVKVEQTFSKESGIELRAASQIKPDSAITYAATGELSSKTLYQYSADGNISMETAQDWTDNTGWVNTSRIIYEYEGDYVKMINYKWESSQWTLDYEYTEPFAIKVYLDDSEGRYRFYFPDPSGIYWIAHGFTVSGVYNYKCTPTYDPRGNLTYIKGESYAIANPETLYPAACYSISYNPQNQPVLIVRTDKSVEDLKIEYQYNIDGELVFYEHTEFYNNQWESIKKYEYINGTMVETGQNRQTISKTDSNGYVYTKQFFVPTANKWYMTHYIIYYPNDLIPNAAVENSAPVGNDNQGSFDVNVNIPTDSIGNGSITVTFPEGFTLDENSTGLTLDFAGLFDLTITKQDNNSWLLEIKPKTLRSASLRAGEAGKMLQVAYTVDKGIEKGTYEISVNSILFETKSGNYIPEPAITVPAVLTRESVANELIESAGIMLYLIDRTLYIQSEKADRITVYSTVGQQLYETAIQPGMNTVNAANLPQGILIVRGSSGWVMKVANR